MNNLQPEVVESHNSQRIDTSKECTIISPSEVQDSTVWVTFYDLQPDQTEEYLAWAHTIYHPWLLKQTGYLWAAHYRHIPTDIPHLAEIGRALEAKPEDAPGVGTGGQYALLIGAAGPDTFLSRPATMVERPASASFRDMLGLRRGLRSGIMKDVMRVNGPRRDTRPSPGPTAPVIQFGNYRVYEGKEPDLWNVYISMRHREIIESPGAVSLRNLVGCVGWARFGVLYEFEDIEAHRHFSEFNESRFAVATDTDPHSFQVRKTVIQSPGGVFKGERIWSSSIID